MRKWLLLLLSAVLAGCTATGAPNAVWIDRATQTALPAPHCAGDTEFTELLTAEYKERRDKLLVHAVCRGETLEVIGMLPVGARLFTIRQEGNALQVTKHVPLGEAIAPEQILWDMHLAHFSGGESAQIPGGYRLKEQENVKTLVNSKGDTVERIVYSDNFPALIENVPFGYRITIKKLR
jgi:hypothetical protein